MTLTHLHLMLNHLPVLGPTLGLLLLLLGLARGSEEWKRAGLALFIVAAVFVIPTYLTGAPAEQAVQGLPGIDGKVNAKHEEVAQLASSAALVLGGLSVSALLLFRRSGPMPNWFAAILLAVALTAAALMAWTANLGGEVRHTEIRPVPALRE
ncbi:MAG: hypothetical protein HZA90_17730 [Verrucomicrobia bacterium]|nr:hypothetical protein [Verrucomicrobiota bacterium]